MGRSRDIADLLSNSNGKIASAKLDIVVDYENIVDTGTEGTKVASGTTAQRGSTAGQVRFNTSTGLAEYYTGSAFKSIDAPPTISSLDVTEVDSQAGGNQTIVITGSGFNSGATVTFIGNAGTDFNASTITRDSDTQITAIAPKSSFLNAQEPYGVKVSNVSGLSATLASQINVDTSPSWTTASGSLGSVEEGASASFSVAASDPDGDTVAYSETGGTVLSTNGLSINSSSGAITGTAGSVTGDTTINFTLRATANTKTADRAFSIIITEQILDGSTQAKANTSAAAIKSLTGTTTNGLYWIKPTGIATAFQVYCNMNIDGGIMMLMKCNSGSSTFGYSSSYWTGNSLYNDGTPTLTIDADYKYQSARDIPISYIYITESTMTNGYKYTLGQTVTGIHNIWGGTNTGFSPTSSIGNGISDNDQIFKTDTEYGTGMSTGSSRNSSWSKNPSQTSNGSWGGYARIGYAQAFDYGPWESVHGEARGLGLRADDWNQGTGYRSSVHDQILWGK